MTDFKVGDRVRIAKAHPPGHRRIPEYIRGKTGTIERYCGEFRNPEELAYGIDCFAGRSTDAKRALYRVRFKQSEVWRDYRGPDGDTLDLEVQEHWLQKA